MSALAPALFSEYREDTRWTEAREWHHLEQDWHQQDDWQKGSVQIYRDQKPHQNNSFTSLAGPTYLANTAWNILLAVKDKSSNAARDAGERVGESNEPVPSPIERAPPTAGQPCTGCCVGAAAMGHVVAALASALVGSLAGAGRGTGAQGRRRVCS